MLITKRNVNFIKRKKLIKIGKRSQKKETKTVELKYPEYKLEERKTKMNKKEGK